MRIDHAASTPLYQQVAADIRRRIVSGDLPVGVQLPTHRELATRYDVSLITINKALAGLVSEGILYSRVGRGTFVALRPLAHEPRPNRLIGFVLRDLTSPFFSRVAHAAQQRADERGSGLLFAASFNRLDREEEQIQRLQDLRISGLIIASMSRTYTISEPIRRLSEAGVPYVMVSYTHGEDVPFIGLDLSEAGFIATEHLVALGRRRIGYVGDRFGSILYEVRGSGYRRALERHGVPVDPTLLFEYPLEGEWNDYRSGYMIGERIAALAEKPDGMFVFNDLGAIGVMDALIDRGIRVPEDIAIVGLDDIELAARARVPLTTVRQPTERIGAAAVEFVLARLAGESPPLRLLFEPHLVVRRSCGAPAAAPASDPASSRGELPHFTLFSGESR